MDKPQHIIRPAVEMTNPILYHAVRELCEVVEEAIISDRLDDPSIIKFMEELKIVILSCKCQLPGFDPDEQPNGACPLCGCDPTFFCDLHSFVDASDEERGV